MTALSKLRQHKKHLLVVLVLLGVAVLFFGNVLFTGSVLVGDNLAWTYPWRWYASKDLLEKTTNGEADPLVSYYPQRAVAAEIVKGGDIPLWNPYYLGGVPFLATEPWGAFFYPLHAIYYLLPPSQAFGYSACLHLFLASLFAYWYLRSIQVERLGALFGAIALGFGGFFLVNLMWLPIVCTAAWAPLVFACFECYWRRRRWTHAILMALAIAMCLLAGYPITFVFIMFGFALYVAARVGLSLRERGGPAREIAKPVVVAVVAVVAGVLLSAVQLLPTYEASQFAERVHLPYEERIDPGRSPVALATALVPDVFGNPADPATPSWSYEQFGKGVPVNYAPPNIYTGILPLILGTWALTNERNRYTLFFWALAALSISIFLDFPGLVFRVLYLLPVFRIGRQVEAKALYGFAVAVLAAFGFSSLLREMGDGRRLTTQRVGCAVMCLGIAVAALAVVGARLDSFVRVQGLELLREWYSYNVPNFFRFALLLMLSSALLILRSRRATASYPFCALAFTLLVVDLFWFGWKFNRPQNPQDSLFLTEGISFLQKDQDIFRVVRGPGGKKVLPPNTAAVFGISDLQGFSPVVLDYYASLVGLIEDDICGVRAVRNLREVSSLDSKLLDMLNVKYILTRPMGTDELIRKDAIDDTIELVYDGDMKIYWNKDALPRAFAVTEFVVLRTREEILAELASEQFEPGRIVILEEEPQMRYPSVGPPSERSRADILEYGPNRVLAEAEMSEDGFLVLGDVYYNGWRAFVDGEVSHIYKANYALRAVQLTQGRHTVEFLFEPLSFRIGAYVSGLSLLAMAAFVALRVNRDRLQSGPGDQ